MGTVIKDLLEEVWHKSQEPDAQERWDLRFAGIQYLPRSAEDERWRRSFA